MAGAANIPAKTSVQTYRLSFAVALQFVLLLSVVSVASVASV